MKTTTTRKSRRGNFSVEEILIKFRFNKPLLRTSKTKSKNILKTLPCPKRLAKNCITRLECFLVIIFSEIIDDIIKYTNIFIARRKAERKEPSDILVQDRDYKPILRIEMKAVFRALFLISIQHGNRVNFSIKMEQG